jgi:hypothetical protein
VEVLQSYQGVASSGELQSFSWEDVMKTIDEAKAEYAAKATKSKGRAALRSRPAMKTLHVLTNVIPEEKGLSALRGGLTLTFKVSSRPTNCPLFCPFRRNLVGWRSDDRCPLGGKGSLWLTKNLVLS